MLLYDVLRECDARVRSPELRPTIRQFIQKAIETICTSNAPGHDWSFLQDTLTIERDSASTESLLIFKAPSNLRALIEVLSLGGVAFNELITRGYNIEWTGRILTITRAPSSTAFPSGTLTVSAYVAHPSVLVTDQTHVNPTWNDEWTPAWPPRSAVRLPDEAFGLLVDETLLLIRKEEDETNFSIEDLKQACAAGLAALRENYALQIYPLNPPDTPTVRWLIAVGNNEIGGEKHKNQLLSYVNELAGEFADVAKVPLDQRPTTIASITDAALPNIDSIQVAAQYWVAGMRYKAATLAGKVTEQHLNAWESAKNEWQNNYVEAAFLVNSPDPPTVEWLVNVGCHLAGGRRYEQQILSYVNELAGEFADVAKVPLDQRPNIVLAVSNAALPKINNVAIPADYWKIGMEAKTSAAYGKPNEVLLANWEKAKNEWQTNYYAINVNSGSFGLDTFGGLVEFIRTEWRSCRNDHQAWTIANEAVDDVMSRVNTDALIEIATITLVAGQREYNLPANCKSIVKIEINGNKIPGRSLDAQGPVTPNMTTYQYIGCGGQAFRLLGEKIVLDLPPGQELPMTVYYYKDHVWTLSESAKVPVKPLLVIKAIKAAIALEEGDANKAQFYQMEYEKAIQQYNANQRRIHSPEDRIINATPRISRIAQAFKK